MLPWCGVDYGHDDNHLLGVIKHTIGLRFRQGKAVWLDLPEHGLVAAYADFEPSVLTKSEDSYEAVSPAKLKPLLRTGEGGCRRQVADEAVVLVPASLELCWPSDNAHNVVINWLDASIRDPRKRGIRDKTAEIVCAVTLA